MHMKSTDKVMFIKDFTCKVVSCVAVYKENGEFLTAN